MLWADSVCLQSQALIPTAVGTAVKLLRQSLSPLVFCLYPLQPSTPSMLSCGSVLCELQAGDWCEPRHFLQTFGDPMTFLGTLGLHLLENVVRVRSPHSRLLI